MVAEFYFGENRRALGIEQVALERGDGEIVVDGLFLVILEAELGVVGRKLAAVVDEAEEGLDGVVEVVAIAHLVGGEIDHFQIAEGFDGITFKVFLGFDGEVTELGAGFQIEAGRSGRRRGR